MDVEAPEVHQLAGRVDLGLLGGLGLAEHRGGGDGLAPGARQQVGGLEQDRGAVVEGHRAPGRGGGQGGVDGVLGVLAGGVGVRTDDGLVVVRLHDVEALAAAHPLLAVDGHRQVDRVAGQLLELRLQAGALRGTGGVAVHRLVVRGGDVGHGVHVGRLLRSGVCGCVKLWGAGPRAARCVRSGRGAGRPAQLLVTSERRKNARLAGRSARRRMK